MIGSYTNTLSINNAHPDHSGVYTCIARNSAASANHSSTLQVNGNYIYTINCVVSIILNEFTITI